MHNNIKEFREMFGFSQRELAVRLNVSRQTIISIEKGGYNPSLELAFKISKIFNCKIEEIFIFED
ncbi:helix-turn-helix transcriptional regulator [Alteribacter populi]|uniref:helix-turn-helix transcriptional regulator n=1 Tax=Alteribacter populi TaxID=2011011 RepID=UPI000BBA7AC1|nr:helix-turn-helix transcriptional regulator [Alteribacter populi]